MDMCSRVRLFFGRELTYLGLSRKAGQNSIQPSRDPAPEGRLAVMGSDVFLSTSMKLVKLRRSVLLLPTLCLALRTESVDGFLDP